MGCALCHRRRSQSTAQRIRRTGRAQPDAVIDADQVQDLLALATTVAGQSRDFLDRWERAPRRIQEDPWLRDATKVIRATRYLSFSIDQALNPIPKNRGIG